MREETRQNSQTASLSDTREILIQSSVGIPDSFLRMSQEAARKLESKDMVAAVTGLSQKICQLLYDDKLRLWGTSKYAQEIGSSRVSRYITTYYIISMLVNTAVI